MNLFAGAAEEEAEPPRWRETRLVDYVPGCAMLVRREVFEEARVKDAWRGALSDDYALTHAVRRAGLRVVGPGGTRLRLPRSVVRSGLKFLPWQMAHTAMFHIPGFPMSPGEPPAWSPVILSIAWLLVAAYLLGLTPIFGRRTLYDRIAGSTVVEADPGRQRPRSP